MGTVAKPVGCCRRLWGSKTIWRLAIAEQLGHKDCDSEGSLQGVFSEDCLLNHFAYPSPSTHRCHDKNSRPKSILYRLHMESFIFFGGGLEGKALPMIEEDVSLFAGADFSPVQAKAGNRATALLHYAIGAELIGIGIILLSSDFDSHNTQ